MPHASSNPLTILILHDTWATRELLSRCGSLSPEQFHQRFNFGIGSIHDTFLHIIAAMVRWSERIDGRPLTPWRGPEENATKYSVQELISMLDDAGALLIEVADNVSKTGLDATINLGSGYSDAIPNAATSKAAAFIHVTTHGTHHRSQLFHMLRLVGVPLESGNFDPVEWDLRQRTSQQ
ncbi:MAG: DinB family protein [Phycisphaerales bacterium]